MSSKIFKVVKICWWRNESKFYLFYLLNTIIILHFINLVFLWCCPVKLKVFFIIIIKILWLKSRLSCLYWNFIKVFICFLIRSIIPFLLTQYIAILIHFLGEMTAIKVNMELNTIQLIIKIGAQKNTIIVFDIPCWQPI